MRRKEVIRPQHRTWEHLALPRCVLGLFQSYTAKLSYDSDGEVYSCNTVDGLKQAEPRVMAR